MYNCSLCYLPLIGQLLRTTVVYLAILIGLRAFGKREIGQMSPFDLMLLLLISNAVQNARVGPDSSLTGGLMAALMLLLLNWIVARLRLHSSSLRFWVEGTPTVLIAHGEIITENLRKEGISEEELQASLREHGLANASHVALAVLEVDGMISIVAAEENVKQVRHKRRRQKP